jgi:hypothetical protein
MSAAPDTSPDPNLTEAVDHPTMYALVNYIAREVSELHKKVHDFDGKLSIHMEQESETLVNTVNELVAQAFPEGDADGHRRHHEAVIAAAENRALLYRQLQVKLAEWGLIGFVGWMIIKGWKAFLLGPG